MGGFVHLLGIRDSIGFSRWGLVLLRKEENLRQCERFLIVFGRISQNQNFLDRERDGPSKPANNAIGSESRAEIDFPVSCRTAVRGGGGGGGENGVLFLFSHFHKL